ncbi:MAG: hypothetical protein US74_C0005G0010 [Parcubacteria group bacterium GW2011_GWA2_38_13]|nr:MAG: hypothetical protein US74_C0005G0010 [Parcubacteria group bacterium GW2011_GWA2_38_13]
MKNDIIKIILLLKNNNPVIMKKYFIGGILFLFFFLPQMVFAQIIINEIGAYEKPDHEWVEIYNNGTNAIDITDWKFYEYATNHELNAIQGDMIIEGGEYAIIAQKAGVFISDKNFSGTVIDSSWSSLNETNGEEIGLKDNLGNIIELFTYIGAPNFSLERADPKLADYSSANWKEHTSGNTAGFQNSNYGTGGNTPPTEPEPTPTPLPAIPEDTLPTPTTTNQTSSQGSVSPTYSYHLGDIVINEFVPDPADGENEWIELFNKTSHTIDMSDWYVEEGSESKTNISGIIPARGFIIIENLKGNLNNSGDNIFLKDGNNIIIDQVAYGDWKDSDPADNAPQTNDPNSTARIYDGYDSGNDYNDFKVTAKPTKGSENIISEEKKPNENQIQYSKSIIINEILPNPATSSDEFIELKNVGTADVNLTGWKLGDATENRFEIPLLNLQPNGIKAFMRSETKVVLNNSGKEDLKLFWPNGELANIISYSGQAPRGKSFSRDKDGKWVWSSKITPGEDNAIEKENEPPISVIQAPQTALVNDIISLDASDSYDPDGDILQFAWDFGDGRKDIREKPFQMYIKPGQYTVSLKVIDAKNASSTAQQIIRITEKGNDKIVKLGNYETDNSQAIKIYISEFLPNPTGDDLTGEFIELFNPNNFTVDLANWVLDDSEGGSDPHAISEEYEISPNQYILFPREETQIALNNTTDGVRLLNPLGALIEETKYEKTFEGVSFIRNEKGMWEMTKTPTPGEINALNPLETAPFAISSLENFADIMAGNEMYLEGIALVEPGILGSQIFYLGDASGSTQIYMYKKDWPAISQGDRIKIAGVASAYKEEPRIKLSQKSDIQIIEKQNAPVPELIKISDIADTPHGILATVVGEVTDIKANGFYIDDGTDELYSYIKQSTGIKKNFKNGDMVSITGILVKTASDTRILPRYTDDIKVTKILSASLKDAIEEEATKNTIQNSMNPYLISTIIAMVLINARLLYILKKKEITE